MIRKVERWLWILLIIVVLSGINGCMEKQDMEMERTYHVNH